MSKAKPWIVDAAQLQDEADDIAAFRQRILHETDVIADFLSLDGRDKLYVIAPKGYGKTLLLQAKRCCCSSTGKGLSSPRRTCSWTALRTCPSPGPGSSWRATSRTTGTGCPRSGPWPSASPP